MKKIKFIDLFCGIGGFRLGFDSNIFECVFSCDIDSHARQIYFLNFHQYPLGDIKDIDENLIPDHDILLAGFPCQTFSISGKKLGFSDETRGTLFFEILRIIKIKKPKVILLENVKNLVNHDKGKTFKIILDTLVYQGYNVSYEVLNASDFGVPQNRERIIIVGTLFNNTFNFKYLKLDKSKNLKSILENNTNFSFLNEKEYTLLNEKKIQKSGLIFAGYRNKKIRIKGSRPNTEHLSRVHKQPNRIYSAEGFHPTIASQETAGRYFIEVDNKVRSLTLQECFNLMGFPKNFIKIGTKGKLYERIGNSVCVPMIKKISEQIFLQFFKEKENMLKENNILIKMNEIYDNSLKYKNFNEFNLPQEILEMINLIVEYEETNKGVFTVLITSIVYKLFYPKQDIRFHQANMKNGYSGRSFDTQYITPFLRSKNFLGAMAESGWLTRSLEQNVPYTLDYPGKITPFKIKNVFLKLINFIQNDSKNSKTILSTLEYLFFMSNKEKSKKLITLINPINKREKLDILQILNLLKTHFYYKYNHRGASILPVIAIYSIYECLLNQMSRFEDKKLLPLSSHTSSDRSSKMIGDINIANKDNSIFESVEVKFEIPITENILEWAYRKIIKSKIERFYMLSTIQSSSKEFEKLLKFIDKINEEHGCQVIINGLIETIKYYLRLLENTDEFLNNYIKNINSNVELNYEHKIAWNNIINNLINSFN